MIYNTLILKHFDWFKNLNRQSESLKISVMKIYIKISFYDCALEWTIYKNDFESQSVV